MYKTLEKRVNMLEQELNYQRQNFYTNNVNFEDYSKNISTKNIMKKNNNGGKKTRPKSKGGFNYHNTTERDAHTPLNKIQGGQKKIFKKKKKNNKKFCGDNEIKIGNNSAINNNYMNNLGNNKVIGGNKKINKVNKRNNSKIKRSSTPINTDDNIYDNY